MLIYKNFKDNLYFERRNREKLRYNYTYEQKILLTTLSLSPLLANEYVQSKDIYLSYQEYITLKDLNSRLLRLRRYIGFANFNVVSYNEALYYGRNYSKIGSFTKAEISLVDKLFSEDPNRYGFYGAKTCTDINNKISKKILLKSLIPAISFLREKHWKIIRN